MSFEIYFNNHLIDLENPGTEWVSMEAIDRRLSQIKRFSNHPHALNVLQHEHIVARLVSWYVGAHAVSNTPNLMTWARHHDAHEAVIGDIPQPVKAYIRSHTDALERIEHGLDLSICEVLGITYPSPAVLAVVKYLDRIAMAMEWRFCLGRDPHPSHPAIPFSDDSAIALINEVRHDNWLRIQEGF
jgi:hypothetical protein